MPTGVRGKRQLYASVEMKSNFKKKSYIINMITTVCISSKDSYDFLLDTEKQLQTLQSSAVYPRPWENIYIHL